MTGRRVVWSDPEILKRLEDFIPAADEVHHLQTVKGPEGELFRKIAEQGHYAGRTKPTNTRQGIYATAPSGVLLASINTNSPKEMKAMLERALAKWKELPKEERLQPELPKSERSRWESRYPADGLALRVIARDLPREGAKPDARWNLDYAWFTKEEMKSLAQEGEVPADLVRRVARCHLLDFVRGQTWLYENKQVEKAALSAKIVREDGDVVELRYEGAVRMSAEGKWPVRGFEDMNSPKEQKRGYEATLLGRAKFDRPKGRFVEFELLAVGTRWGGTQYNARGDDLGSAPLGIGFTLAGDTPPERVAPAFIWGYGWK